MPFVFGAVAIAVPISITDRTVSRFFKALGCAAPAGVG